MWPLIVLAASAAAKYANDRNALNRQRRLQSAMENYQRSQAQQGLAAQNKYLATVTPDQRQAETDQAIASRVADMNAAVGQQRAASQALTNAQTPANVGVDYQNAQKVADTRVNTRVARAIQQLATMDAPGQTGLQTNLRFGRAAGTVDATNRAAANVGEGYRSDIAGVRPNPFVDLAANIGMGVGAGGMMAAAAAPEAGATAAGDAGYNTDVAWGDLDNGPGAYYQPKPSPTFMSRYAPYAMSIFGSNPTTMTTRRR